MIGRSTAASLPTYGTGWTAPSLPNFRTEEVPDGNGQYPWRHEENADAMIDKYRKGECRITVVNSANAPIPGASVSAVMTEHAFIWGIMLTEWALHGARGANGEAYRAKVFDGTWNAFYHESAAKQGLWEGGKVIEYPYTDKAGAVSCIALAKAARKWREVRGHVLNYCLDNDFFYPPGLWPADYAGRRTQWRNVHIPDKCDTLINDVTFWELSNELSQNSNIYSTVNGVRYLNPDYVSDVQLAYAAQRGRPVYINDFMDFYTLRQHAVHLINNGIPIAAIGLQGHVSGPFTYSAAMGYAEQALTVPDVSNALAPWDVVLTEVDYSGVSAAQAGLNETSFVKAAFALPQCRGFNNWGAFDDTSWIGGGCYYASPTSGPNPRMDAFNALVHGTWKTTSSGSTNGSGYHQFRGTFGAYDLTVTSGATTVTRSFELHPGMREIVIVIP